MPKWVVAAARNLPIADTDRAWDGPGTRRRVLRWAGWPDSPQPARARRAFLVYDAENPELAGSYKLPFADVVDGRLMAIPSGLRAAASRLPQADIPPAVRARARAVLDGYFRRMERAKVKATVGLWDELAGMPEVLVLGVPFGGPGEGDVDAQGERFTPETDIWLSPGDVVPLTYFHGLDEPRPEPVGAARYEYADERGHWFRARVDTAHPLARRVVAALEAGGAVRASTGSAVHLVRLDDTRTNILVWPVAELAVFDVDEVAGRVPANDYAVVLPAKGGGVQGVRIGGAPDGDAARAEELNGRSTHDGGDTMSDVETRTDEVREEQAVAAKAEQPDEGVPAGGTTETMAVDVEAVVKAAVEEAVKAARAEFEQALAARAEQQTTAEPARAVQVQVAVKRARPWLIEDEAAVTRGIRALADRAARVVYLPLTKGEFEARFKALAEGTDTAGGYLVPVEQSRMLIELLTARSVVRRAGATVLPMASDTLEIPTQTGGATAYWTAENAAITASQQTFGRVTLVAKKLAALTQMSRELVEDSDPAVEAIVREDLARVLALAEDLAYLRGDGTGGQPTGILNITGVTVTQLGTGNGATPTFDDLADAVYRLDAADAPMDRRAWVVHPRTVNTLRKIKDANGEYIWSNPAAPGDPPTVWGYPVLTTTQIPINLTVGTATNASEIYLAAWREALVGQRRAIELRASDVAGTAFQNDQVWVRATMRVDFNVRHVESFQVLTGVLP